MKNIVWGTIMISTTITRRHPTRTKELLSKIRANPNLHLVSYKVIWKHYIYNFLQIMGIKNSVYLLVYKYLLCKFHVSREEGYLEMSNKDITKNINSYMDRKDVPIRLGINQVSRAITELTTHLIILTNGKPFLIRKRYGKKGRKSIMLINSAMLPKEDVNEMVVAYYSVLKELDKQIFKVKIQLKFLKGEQLMDYAKFSKRSKKINKLNNTLNTLIFEKDNNEGDNKNE